MIHYFNGYIFARNVEQNDENYAVLDILDIPNYIQNLEKEFSHFALVRFFNKYELRDGKQKKQNHLVSKLIAKTKPKKPVNSGFKRSLSRRYRHPRTMAETRNIDEMDTLNLTGLVRRRADDLPTSRSSILKSNAYTRNWKHYRKTQYK